MELVSQQEQEQILVMQADHVLAVNTVTMEIVGH